VAPLDARNDSLTEGTQSRVTKVGAGEARKTKNSTTVHRGDDEVAASAGEYMSKDEIRSAERAQAVLKQLGIEVPIKNRQALTLMRGDPSEYSDLPLCSDILGLVPDFLEASTLQWDANPFLKDQDWLMNLRMIGTVAELNISMGNFPGETNPGFDLEDFRLWSKDDKLSYRGQVYTKLTTAQKRGALYPANLDGLSPTEADASSSR